MSKPTFTLITGASAGIGKAIAEQFAANGHALILVARSADKLTELATSLHERHGVETVVHAADLAHADAGPSLRDALANHDIGTVINNAGVLSSGGFYRMAEADIDRMLLLNVASLTSICRAFAPRLIERGNGRIVNVASIAAFQPAPQLAVYAATKAYVLSLSESLSLELGKKGVAVTAVCPGYTDTDMLRGPVAQAAGKIKIPEFTVLTPETVARDTYKGCMKGTPVVVPGTGYSLAMAASGVLPRWLKRSLANKATGTR